MITNATVYRIESTWAPDHAACEAALAAQKFAPCSASQEKAAGWLPPRGEEHGALVEQVNGQWILSFMVERKSVPTSVINRRADERKAQIEAETGRKPGKRETKELKEDIKRELLAFAFAKQARVPVWIDSKAALLVIASTSSAVTDEVVSCLVQHLEKFAVRLIHTKQEPAAAMAGWLHGEAPEGFTVDRECELRATDESRAVVRYAKHALDIDEIRKHIEGGKRPTRVALTWDDRVSFVLTDSMQVRKITFLESGVNKTTDAKDVDDFDTDVTITTGELAQMLPVLIAALGGETEVGGAGGDAGQGASETHHHQAHATEAAGAKEEEAVF